MRKLLLLSFLIIAVIAHARQISEGEAASIASEFLNSAAVRQTPAKAGVRRAKAPNAANAEAAPFYVYNADDNQGFVIVSGDDRAQRILGYSDKGSFDFNNLPPQLEWLLSNYEKEINSIDDSNVIIYKYKNEVLDQDDKSPITPLITTRWGQDAPYSNQCPEFDGSRLPVGCVATAIAQIMNYHRWPDVGEDSYSYSWNGTNLSYDFESTIFDWNRMLDSYDNDSPVESQDEVAKLMYAVGVGCNMGYYPGGSGSDISFAKRALVENFKYDTETEIVWKNHYLPKKWDELIYSELSSNRPIYVQGGIHAFVCDGYDGNGMFHFNWGWYGDMDGYFVFSSLIVGDDNYSSDLLALINLHPRTGEKKPLTFDYICKGGVRFDSETFNSDYVELDICQNYSAYNLDGTFGFEVVNNKSGKSDFFQASEIHASAVVPMIPGVVIDGHGHGGFTNSIQGLSEGYYTVYPAFTTPATPMKRILCSAGDQDHIDLQVSQNGESYIYTNPGPSVQPDLELIDFQIVDEEKNPIENVYAHESLIHFTYTLKNNSSTASTNNTVLFINKNDEVVKKMNIIIPLIEPMSEYSGYCGLVGSDFAPGTYQIKVLDAADKCINTKPITFTALKREYQLEVSNIMYSGREDMYDHFTFDLKNNSEMDYGPILYAVVTKDGTEYRRSSIPTGLEANKIYEGLTFTVEKLQGNVEINLYEPYGQKINEEPFRMYFNVPINWLGFEKWGFSLLEGNSDYLIPIISPEDATNKALEWESSNPNVAQVDRDGKVTAIARGTAIITIKATDGSGITASCNVEVLPIVKSLSITPTQLVGISGDEFYFQTAITPSDAFNPALDWSSSDESVATIDQGHVKLLSEGYCIITASTTDGSELQATCEVTVRPSTVMVSSISLTPVSTTGKAGEQIQISATVLPENATNKTISWSSSDEGIATVSDSGLVSLIKEGTAVIIASATDESGVSAKGTVIVVATPAAEIVLSSSSIELEASETVQLSATILPETTTDKTIVWMSSDESVAVVDQSGFVTALSEGKCVVTAMTTDGSELSATCEITVKKPEILVSSISLTPFSATGKTGEQIQISAAVLPENATNKTISWSSSDESIATVSDSGLVSLIKKGQAVITASATDESGVSAECAIIVSETSGIADILNDKSAYVRIFNMQGIQVYEGPYSEAKLAPDYYIVVCGGKSIKVKVE